MGKNGGATRISRWAVGQGRKAFVPVTLEPFPLEKQENKTRQKYLEKPRRLCVLMRRMREEDDADGMDKVALYREILPGVSDRTRQRAVRSGCLFNAGSCM